MSGDKFPVYDERVNDVEQGARFPPKDREFEHVGEKGWLCLTYYPEGKLNGGGCCPDCGGHMKLVTS